MSSKGLKTYYIKPSDVGKTCVKDKRSGERICFSSVLGRAMRQDVGKKMTRVFAKDGHTTIWQVENDEQFRRRTGRWKHMSSATIRGFRIWAGKCDTLRAYEDNLYESTAEAYGVLRKHRCKGLRPQMSAELDNEEELIVDYGYDLDVGEYRFELLNEEGAVIIEDPKVGDALTKEELGY